MINFSFIPNKKLVAESEPEGVPKSTIKARVLEDLKLNALNGVSEQSTDIDFDPDDGSDILVKKIDPEKALGYQVFSDVNSYFARLEAEAGNDTAVTLGRARRG